MKKAVYRLILFAAVTAFILALSPTAMAESNDTQTKQNQCIASDTNALPDTDKPEQAPPKQPTSDKESAADKDNSQLQLAKEHLRGDFYKESQDSLKWALGIIIGFVVGLIIYTIFKDRKEYEKACENAKEAYNKAELAQTQAEKACEKAREYELKAQEQLATIDKAVKDKLEEIDTKAKETLNAIKAEAKAGQEKIEKKGKEERQKSSDEAERQRKISKLFSKGFKAIEAKDYETAADCYRQIVEVLKEENSSEVYNNWSNALWRLAESKKGKEAEMLLKQAVDKCQKALEINPKDDKAYNNWGASLTVLAHRKKGKEAEDLLEQAEEKLLKAESIKTGAGAYNLACIYALRGNEEKCKEWLKVREKAGTLNTREYAMADYYLKSVRDNDWFKNLRWKGE